MELRSKFNISLTGARNNCYVCGKEFLYWQSTMGAGGHVADVVHMSTGERHLTMLMLGCQSIHQSGSDWIWLTTACSFLGEGGAS